MQKRMAPDEMEEVSSSHLMENLINNATGANMYSQVPYASIF